MDKPTILAVDDDADVLRAIARDLQQRYGEDYRVLRADSSAAALEALRELRLRDASVALIVADQRMPGLSGVEFLEEALAPALFPDAKRVLLTAYSDTAAAIRAINVTRIDYYLVKPWDPPAERLYPILDDLLDDWRANHPPPFQGIRVVGSRWSSATHQLKELLARNQIPYQAFDPECSEEARRLLPPIDSGPTQLPLVIFPDGTRLAAPGSALLAEKLGLHTRAERPFYDLVIVGGGPAGLAAAVYGASEGLGTLLIEREAPGGQAGTSSRIENYLGFPHGLSGDDLARRAVLQAGRFGVEVLRQEVVGVRRADPYRIVTLADGTEISCHALIIATGVSYRTLDDIPGMARLQGCGVYYGAALSEAANYREQEVYLVGGANSAGQAAMYFANHARRVTLLARSPLAKGMSRYLIDQLAATPAVRVWEGVGVREVHGQDNLEALSLSRPGGEPYEPGRVAASGLFVFIGAAPHTDWAGGLVERDGHGFIPTGPALTRDGKHPRGWTADRDPFLLESSIPGIFVAGDVRQGSVKRVASGVGEGAIAVSLVHQYLSAL
ncbi:MAG TPA: FAD-dependent oxidoreductase [Thermomicrobiales bacterium]|jgi:thioredoxin reductase (NADPH)